MSLVEWIAAAAGIVCVWLVVRRSLWNYPFAILSVGLLGFVFVHARLYSDALLQSFYVAVNLYGWRDWSRSRGRGGEVRVERMSPPERGAWLAGGAAATLLWGWGMARWTDAASPWWDAGVAIPSIVAQILLARRRIENWAVWIAVDLAAVPLYATKHLWAASGLYVIYLGLSAWGWRDWCRTEARQARAR